MSKTATRDSFVGVSGPVTYTYHAVYDGLSATAKIPRHLVLTLSKPAYDLYVPLGW